MPALQRTGHSPEAIALATKHRDALRARLTAAGRAVPATPTDRQAPVTHRAGVLHVGPFRDAPLEDDPAMTPETLVIERTIQPLPFFERGRGR